MQGTVDLAVGALINATLAESANKKTKGGQGNVYCDHPNCTRSGAEHPYENSRITKESIQRARLIEGKFTRTAIMWRYILAHGVLREN